MNVQSVLPLTETTFFILLSLEDGPKHGYAILKDIQELSTGRVDMATGTLYGALKRLVEQDWIERIESSQPDETGRPRKEYHLTGLGGQLLAAEVTRLTGLVTVARARSLREAL